MHYFSKHKILFVARFSPQKPSPAGSGTIECVVFIRFFYPNLYQYSCHGTFRHTKHHHGWVCTARQTSSTAGWLARCQSQRHAAKDQLALKTRSARLVLPAGCACLFFSILARVSFWMQSNSVAFPFLPHLPTLRDGCGKNYCQQLCVRLNAVCSDNRSFDKWATRWSGTVPSLSFACLFAFFRREKCEQGCKWWRFFYRFFLSLLLWHSPGWEYFVAHIRHTVEGVLERSKWNFDYQRAVKPTPGVRMVLL